MSSRKPIFVITIPQDVNLESFERHIEELRKEYHVLIIQTPFQNDITFELLNGSFWQYFFQWLKSFKKPKT